MASQYEDLEKLADLKNKGIITEEEFNKKKSEVLSNAVVSVNAAEQKDSSAIKNDPIVLSVNSKGNEADLNIDHKQAFDLTCEALRYIKYMKIEDANNLQGYIKVSTSFNLTAFKNAEIIEIFIKSNSPQSSNVLIKSKIKNALGSGSKENINNIFSMIDQCAKARSKNEGIKAIEDSQVKSFDDAANILSKRAQDSFNTQKNTMLASFVTPNAMKIFLVVGTIILLIGLISIFSDDKTKKTVSKMNPLEELENSPVTQLDPIYLGGIFNLPSSYTDVQRDNTKKEIIGKVVTWTLPVYEVKKVKDNTYRVQTVSLGYAGTVAEVTARDPQEASFIESLKTGSMISYKGKITDVTFRHIEIEPAILSRGENAPAMSALGAPPPTSDNARSAASKPNAKIVTGKFNGCSTHQGVVECGISTGDGVIIISDSTSSESVFNSIDPENWIGKNVSLTGYMDARGDYFHASSIKLLE